jgi:transposase
VFHKKSILFSIVAKIGRRTKRTKAVLTPLFEAIRIGVPYKLACMAAGINVDTFMKWRQKDPAFDAEVEQAAAQPAVKLFKTIREQAPETWQAGAWSLERRYPEMFARPEAQLQLNVLAQAAVLNGNGTPHNVEMVVVSDLEFVGLKRHPAYTHRPGVVRQAEQEVPLELAGTLERENRNIIVTSESAAKAKARRYAKIRARTKELLETSSANTVEPPTQGQLSPELDGSLCREDQNVVVVSQSQAEAQKRHLAEARDRLEARHNTLEAGATNGRSGAESEALLQSEPVPAMPSGNGPASSASSQKPASWWRQFVFPVLGRLIQKADAVQALKLVLAELRIELDDRLVDFAADSVAQSVFCQMLEKLTGSDLGWRQLCQIYERQQARERIWADH